MKHSQLKPGGPSPEKIKSAADGLCDLVVWAAPVCNTSLLICHRAGEDGSDPTKLVSVAVRTNVHFLKKMAVRARLVRGNQFALEGPTPRWRGKW